jgi:aspartate aminotransferase, mitochondrial
MPVTSSLRPALSRIVAMRANLRQHIEDLGSTRSWNHITDQIGMFCYTGLTSEQVSPPPPSMTLLPLFPLFQVDRLREEFHVYCTSDGRISISGITTENVEYLALAFHEVTKE